MNKVLRCALAVAGVAFSAQAMAEVTFYEHEGFQGRSFSTAKQVGNLERAGFNDRASSVVVLRERWEVCQDSRFEGQCIVLRPGRYPSLAAMGLNDRVSSVRMVNHNTRVEDRRYAPEALPVYDNRRRKGERVYEAEVTSVRAVVGQRQQRCWIEREQFQQGNANTPAGVMNEFLGGVLGYQAGGQNNPGRDVQRCASAPSQANPDFWDVTYNFRGREHHMQMASPPGRTVSVNGKGEPRA